MILLPWRMSTEIFMLDIPLNLYYTFGVRVFDTDTERRMQEIKDAHDKRHPNCTPDNCHTQYMIAFIDAIKNRIGNAVFLLELNRL